MKDLYIIPLFILTFSFAEEKISHYRRGFFQLKVKNVGFYNVKLFEDTPVNGILPLQYIYIGEENSDDVNRFTSFFKV